MYMGASNYCMKDYSPFLGCSLTAIDPYLPINIMMCNKCKDNYVLVDDVCAWIDTSISCQIVGCEFCVEAN